MTKSRFYTAVSLFLFSLILCGFTSSSQPVISYRPVISGLSSPVDIVNANDGSNRLFIVQQTGVVKIYDQSFAYQGDLVTVTGISGGGERGLLSMTFHPDFINNGFFFVYYTNVQGAIEVARYKTGADRKVADPASKTIIITIPHSAAANHNGGKLNFGSDGYLYFGTGDGGSGGDPPNNSQNRKSLLGKIIRIDVNKPRDSIYYSIPPDNPFVNDTTVASEVWCIGVRNPWRWSFDRATHDMWIADVGQNAWEEINFRKAGETGGLNYGWRCYEGTHLYNTTLCPAPANYIPPIFEYPHNNTTGGFSVTGGFVYRGADYPSLNGYYVFADYVSGNQWTIFPGDTSAWQVTKQPGVYPANISSFGESETGSVYAISLGLSTIYKLEATTGVQFQLASFSGIARNSVAELGWTTSSEANLSRFEVEYSTDSIRFQKRGTVSASNKAAGASYKFNDVVTVTDTVFYRLKIISTDGKWDYSKTISVIVNARTTNFIYPAIVSNGMITLFVPDAYNSLEILAMNGARILTKDIGGVTGRIDVPVPFLAKGIYLIRLLSPKKTSTQKIFIR